MTIRLKAETGTVTIGNFGGGVPIRTTWGDKWRTPDAGVPLHMYDPSALSALAIWKTQPSVRKVVSYAAKQFASLPWHAYQRVSDTDRQRMQGSTLEKLIKRPHDHVTGFSLLQQLCVDKMMYDRWCLLFLPGDNGQQGKLLRVAPPLLDIQSNWLGEVTDIFILNPVAGEADIRITDAPIAISWGWSGDVAGGVSPLTTIREMLIEARRAVQWRSHQWENSPKITGLLKHPGEFKNDDQRTRLVQDWQEWKNNPRNGGTPILEKGMDYIQLKGVTSTDAQDLAGRKLSDEEVAGAFHMPPELLGIREGTYSNIKAINQMLFGPVLGPTIIEFQQALNHQLVGAVDRTRDLYIEIDRESAMAGGFLEQAQMFQTMTGAPVMAVAEARQRLNLPHKEGTDELVQPLNVTQGGQASPTDSGAQNRKPGTEPEEES